MKNIIILILTLLTVNFGYANTTTSASLIKTTTITEIDAARFVNTFTQNFSGDQNFKYKCLGQKQCVITASVTGITGKLADELLQGRSHAEFISNDKQFKLNCGKTKIAYCNIIQHGAVLIS